MNVDWKRKYSAEEMCDEMGFKERDERKLPVAPQSSAEPPLSMYWTPLAEEGPGAWDQKHGLR